MKVGDLVRVKNINFGWDEDPKCGWLLHIKKWSSINHTYYVMVMEGPYLGVAHWISGWDLEVISEGKK